MAAESTLGWINLCMYYSHKNWPRERGGGGGEGCQQAQGPPHLPRHPTHIYLCMAGYYKQCHYNKFPYIIEM